MSTDTPITDDVLTHNVGYANYQLDMLVNESRKLERENARLREELSLANGTIESRDRNIATLQEELAKAKWESAELLADNVKHNDALGRQIYRAEQAEARALVMEKDNQESAT